MILVHFYCEWECRERLGINWGGNEERRDLDIGEENGFMAEGGVEYRFNYYESSSIFIHNHGNNTKIRLICEGK